MQYLKYRVWARDWASYDDLYPWKQLPLSAHHNSVCLPSVCLSHGWISQNWCKIKSPNLHSRLPGKL